MSIKEYERMLIDFISGNSIDAYKYLGSHIEQDYLDFSIEITVTPLGVTFYKLCKEQKTSKQDNKTP